MSDHVPPLFVGKTSNVTNAYSTEVIGERGITLYNSPPRPTRTEVDAHVTVQTGCASTQWTRERVG